VLERMPPREVIVALQIVGWSRRCRAAPTWPRAAFAVAWVCYLVLAGLRASRGKVLHNDLLLLWMSARVPARAPSRDAGSHSTPAHGWPVQDVDRDDGADLLVRGVPQAAAVGDRRGCGATTWST
jgi:hypothetical protein